MDDAVARLSHPLAAAAVVVVAVRPEAVRLQAAAAIGRGDTVGEAVMPSMSQSVSCFTREQRTPDTMDCD